MPQHHAGSSVARPHQPLCPGHLSSVCTLIGCHRITTSCDKYNSTTLVAYEVAVVHAGAVNASTHCSIGLKPYDLYAWNSSAGQTDVLKELAKLSILMLIYTDEISLLPGAGGCPKVLHSCMHVLPPAVVSTSDIFGFKANHCGLAAMPCGSKYHCCVKTCLPAVAHN